jgi:hypothetical protein
MQPSPTVPAPNALERLQTRLRRDAVAFDARWRGDSDRRGMVMVMTMLMMTVLTLLGSAATNATSTQLRENSGTRLEHLAYHVGEAGTMAAVTLAGKIQSGFENYVQNRGQKLDLTDMGGLYNFGTDSSFGHELDALAVPTFEVNVSAPKVAYGVPGYDASRYCFRSYKMTTYGNVGNPSSSKGAEKAQSARMGFQAAVVVGPVVCGG